MATVKPRIAEFRDRITLQTVQLTVDSELNRTEERISLKTVWANVTVKKTATVETDAGTRPTLTYQIVLRKTDKRFEYVVYRSKILRVVAPIYDVDNKYTVFEAVEIDGKEHIVTVVS